MTARPVLAGIGVLIPRPRGQAGALAARIEALGGTPIIFPALEIAPPADPAAFDRRVARLLDYDLIAFVSPTAVERAVPLFDARQPGWRHGRRLAAVGQGTRRALRDLGMTDVLAPEGESGAAALLNLAELSAEPPRRALIVRGEGGREELALGLVSRGSEVDYAECYRRVPAEADPAPLLERWRLGEVGAVIVTSVAILDALLDRLGADGAALLRRAPLFAHHPRIAEAARARGVEKVIETPADEAGVAEALGHYFAHHA